MNEKRFIVDRTVGFQVISQAAGPGAVPPDDWTTSLLQQHQNDPSAQAAVEPLVEQQSAAAAQDVDPDLLSAEKNDRREELMKRIKNLPPEVQQAILDSLNVTGEDRAEMEPGLRPPPTVTEAMIKLQKMQTKKTEMIKPTPKSWWQDHKPSVHGPDGKPKKKHRCKACMDLGYVIVADRAGTKHSLACSKCPPIRTAQMDGEDDLTAPSMHLIGYSNGIGELFLRDDGSLVVATDDDQFLPIDPMMAIQHFGPEIADKIGIGPNPSAGQRDIPEPRGDLFHSPNWDRKANNNNSNRFIRISQKNNTYNLGDIELPGYQTDPNYDRMPGMISIGGNNGDVQASGSTQNEAGVTIHDVKLTTSLDLLNTNEAIDLVYEIISEAYDSIAHEIFRPQRERRIQLDKPSDSPSSGNDLAEPYNDAIASFINHGQTGEPLSGEEVQAIIDAGLATGDQFESTGGNLYTYIGTFQSGQPSEHVPLNMLGLPVFPQGPKSQENRARIKQLREELGEMGVEANSNHHFIRTSSNSKLAQDGTCPKCQGSGKFIGGRFTEENPGMCYQCNGSGKKRREIRSAQIIDQDGISLNPQDPNTPNDLSLHPGGSNVDQGSKFKCLTCDKHLFNNQQVREHWELHNEKHSIFVDRHGNIFHQTIEGLSPRPDPNDPEAMEDHYHNQMMSEFARGEMEQQRNRDDQFRESSNRQRFTRLAVDIDLEEISEPWVGPWDRSEGPIKNPRRDPISIDSAGERNRMNNKRERQRNFDRRKSLTQLLEIDPWNEDQTMRAIRDFSALTSQDKQDIATRLITKAITRSPGAIEKIKSLGLTEQPPFDGLIQGLGLVASSNSRFTKFAFDVDPDYSYLSGGQQLPEGITPILDSSNPEAEGAANFNKENPYDQGSQVVHADDEALILMSPEGKIELYGRSDDFAGFTIRYQGKGYEFVRTIRPEEIQALMEQEQGPQEPDEFNDMPGTEQLTRDMDLRRQLQLDQGSVDPQTLREFQRAPINMPSARAGLYQDQGLKEPWASSNTQFVKLAQASTVMNLLKSLGRGAGDDIGRAAQQATKRATMAYDKMPSGGLDRTLKGRARTMNDMAQSLRWQQYIKQYGDKMFPEITNENLRMLKAKNALSKMNPTLFPAAKRSMYEASPAAIKDMRGNFMRGVPGTNAPTNFSFNRQAPTMMGQMTPNMAVGNAPTTIPQGVSDIAHRGGGLEGVPLGAPLYRYRQAPTTIPQAPGAVSASRPTAPSYRRVSPEQRNREIVDEFGRNTVYPAAAGLGTLGALGTIGYALNPDQGQTPPPTTWQQPAPGYWNTRASSNTRFVKLAQTGPNLWTPQKGDRLRELLDELKQMEPGTPEFEKAFREMDDLQRSLYQNGNDPANTRSAGLIDDIKAYLNDINDPQKQTERLRELIYEDLEPKGPRDLKPRHRKIRERREQEMDVNRNLPPKILGGSNSRFVKLAQGNGPITGPNLMNTIYQRYNEALRDYQGKLINPRLFEGKPIRPTAPSTATNDPSKIRQHQVWNQAFQPGGSTQDNFFQRNWVNFRTDQAAQQQLNAQIVQAKKMGDLATVRRLEQQKQKLYGNPTNLWPNQ